MDVRPIAALVSILILLAAIAGPGQAEFPSEVKAVDAQIARGVISPLYPSENQHGIEERIHALIPEADRNCLPIQDKAIEVGLGARTRAQAGLEEALRQIRKSETGAWLVEVAATRGVTICLDHATALEAHYRSHLHLLGLSARLSPAGRIVFLAHELAHVPQHPHFSNNRRFSPEDMLLLQRVREAAAEAVATRVLWQLRQQGISAPWKEKLRTAYYDIAETFETTMASGRGSAYELWATRSAFHHWFNADWRLEIYDDLMLKTLARIAEDQIGLIATSRYLSDRYLRSIANYGSQGFLIGGDGEALINDFRTQALPAGGRARLDAITAKAEGKPAKGPASLNGQTLSAVNPSSAVPDRD
ncbi:MAG: DUF6782 family putative metallopeptidase [Geminicoccaceae bacterium]